MPGAHVDDVEIEVVAGAAVLRTCERAGGGAMRRAGIAAGCVFALIATAAHAQLKPEVQTGSLIPVKPRTLEREDAGVVRKHFAQCVYRSAKPKVVALLDHSDAVAVDLPGAHIKNVSAELNMESCLGDEVGINENALGMKFSVNTLRDLLAEEAYLANDRTPPSLPSAVPPLDAKFVSTGDGLARAQALTAFADCAVTGDLADADALLRTTPGSDQERAAAVALAPGLGKCLVQGQKVSLTPMSIRALLSYGLWTRFVREKNQ